MKYKIAIMTQPLGANYGGIIQNYALQKVLKDMGHETITIDRRLDRVHSEFKVTASNYKILFLRYIGKSKLPTDWDFQKVFKENRRFLEKQIHLSPKIESTSALISYFKKERFTAVVVGSDQVWRPKYSPNIFNFYLDFLQKDNSVKKVAYAASFGTEAWEYTNDQTKVCNELIGQFDAISVREDTGVQLCYKFLNRKDTVHVLDPTLLLDAEDYCEIINQPKKELGLFTYVLDESNENRLFINACAKKLNLIIHTNQAKMKPYDLQIDKLNDHIIPPLEGWLQGFRDAEFVVTDSFHGTVFAIINKKPFLALVNKDRGSSRFESILSSLDLKDRLIYDVNNFNEVLLTKEIDYEAVYAKLKVLKRESLDFIKKHL